MGHMRASAAGLALVLLLAACTGDAGSPSAAASTVTTPSATVVASERPTPSPAPPSEPAPTSVAAETPEGATSAWTEAATFGGEGITLVTDVSTWDGGFVAIGHAWANGFIGGPGAPIAWTSPDGRSWSEVDPDFGTTDVELRGILPLTTGGIVILGDLGRQTAQNGEGTISAAAWRSDDGQTWIALELPSEIATQGTNVASGPMGHLISTGSEAWYSADAETWRRVYEAPEGVALWQPAAGDEGFVMPAIVDNDRAAVLASGDGRTWYEAEPPTHLLGVSPWGGDWLGWGFTDDPQTISVLRSGNGLDWSVALDVNNLTPADGPKAGLGMESGITEVTFAGDDGVMALTLGFNHCCAQLGVAVGVWTSTDAETWQAADLPPDAYVRAVATDGEVVVAAGYLNRGGQAAFWVASR